MSEDKDGWVNRYRQRRTQRRALLSRQAHAPPGAHGRKPG
jgi:hypothetical protein